MSEAKQNRRTFLKASALGAAAATALSTPAVHAAGDDVVKIGMIGSGGRCSGAAAQAMKAHPSVRLVAMADVFMDRVKAKREVLRKQAPKQVQVDDDYCFADFEGYKKVIDSCDAVLIACASKFHPMYAEAAIKAGKHVFVEKPHGIDPVGVRRMEAAARLAEKKGLSLVSGLHSRFDLGWQETMKRIWDGAIGEITTIQACFLRAPYQTVRRNPDLSETEYQFSNWYHFAWLSGDDVTQSLVHNVDRASWALQEKLPISAFGLGGRSSSFGEVYGDMFDHHTVVYEYENGTRMYAMCRTQFDCYNSYSDYYTGTKGKCDLNHCKIEGETNWRYTGPKKSPYDLEQVAFIESIRSGKPLNSGPYMSNSTMIGVLGQIACYTGKQVSWDDAYKANFQFGPSPEESTFQTKPPALPDATGNYPLPKPGITKLI